jgi:mono/diheme cytochrome c family protein
MIMKYAVGVLVCALSVSRLAIAQQGGDQAASAEHGQSLYELHCVLCHGDSGAGNPPMFPALDANENLADPLLIVASVRQGSGIMPPFPDLMIEDITALANYVRNAWTNNFGTVSSGEVTAALEGVGEAAQGASVWDGVFTEAQAERGRAVYPGPCGLCHGRRLDGASDDPDMRATPPLARARFLRVWEGRTLATLFEYTRATMPEANPASLADQEYVDIIAYMLSVSGMPAGAEELQPDPSSLARFIIRQQP